MANFYVFEKATNKASFPNSIFLNLCVSHFSKDTGGRVFISPELATEQEVDHCVDDLIIKLEKVRKKAKLLLEK